jgi:hypothetical protein
MSLVLRKETLDITGYKLKPDYKNLIMSFQALPGVHFISSNLDKSFDEIKKRWNGVLIFFHIEECTQEGLFFLTRCIDRRYWEHGNKWGIELEVGDVKYRNGDRPITYSLFRAFQEDDVEQNIIDECKSLIDNMMNHFNHDDFMESYNMDRKEYHLVDDMAFDRRVKLEKLGL